MNHRMFDFAPSCGNNVYSYLIFYVLISNYVILRIDACEYHRDVIEFTKALHRSTKKQGGRYYRQPKVILVSYQSYLRQLHTSF